MVVCCLCSAAIECFIIRHLVNTEQNEKAVFCLQKENMRRLAACWKGQVRRFPVLLMRELCI